MKFRNISSLEWNFLYITFTSWCRLLWLIAAFHCDYSGFQLNGMRCHSSHNYHAPLTILNMKHVAHQMVCYGLLMCQPEFFGMKFIIELATISKQFSYKWKFSSVLSWIYGVYFDPRGSGVGEILHRRRSYWYLNTIETKRFCFQRFYVSFLLGWCSFIGKSAFSIYGIVVSSRENASKSTNELHY